MNMDGVCELRNHMRFSCPSAKAFFTASVFWGSIGPGRMFGVDGQYKWLLLGFPVGIVLVLGLFGLGRVMPGNGLSRRVHVAAVLSGGAQWASYSFSYSWPAVPIAWFSWIYMRGRYPAWWSKYNFVLSAALSTGIAMAAMTMHFTVKWAEVNLDWWGNTQPLVGCEGIPCSLRELDRGERFYPWWDASKALHHDT
ncbi:hypothetical protein E4U55_002009 [Claviceps digitariae]|nr:hypothetical protein E4U55_002009 [Claviceps digitariae]